MQNNRSRPPYCARSRQQGRLQRGWAAAALQGRRPTGTQVAVLVSQLMLGGVVPQSDDASHYGQPDARC